ncbi:2'-5' RNA ligase family protein [Hoyosella sp. G463]|uniref:2'-5' RNA ligase family protein n=1 Tax=Lolliginicoccus lacisalsi TaxID=2742202 RepID=A0A927JBY0_9ACTN|nr:2'-5' RNA ligase family protein [Lolliginicoccus lacisalsi]MBD8506335.1 2'-5' RNA ligase family protein [Lolliginicoccus lacisalsi]
MGPSSRIADGNEQPGGARGGSPSRDNGLMVQSVELLLDPGLDAAVRADWEALSSTGIRALRPHHRPHITIGVASEIYPRIDKALARALATLPIPVTLGGLLVFGTGRVVIARAITVSPELVEAHRAVWSAMRDCPGQPRHTAPGEWTPHATLAKRVPIADCATAIGTVARRHDLHGHIVAARRWDGEEHRDWLIAGTDGTSGPAVSGPTS